MNNKDNSRELPPKPGVDNFLFLQINKSHVGVDKWVKMACLSVDNQKLGDAYYYWLLASKESIGDLDKKETYNKCANSCLIEWRKKNVYKRIG